MRAGGGWERDGLLDCGLGDGDDLRAVNEVVAVVAKDSKLSNSGLEAVDHEVLLVNESLPEACSALVASEGEVGLEAQLASVVAASEWQRRSHFTGVVLGSRESLALEQNLEEHLAVESEGRLDITTVSYSIICLARGVD